MFQEIIDLAKFAKEVITERNSKINSWRKVYKLYMSLDDVIASSITANEHYLPHPLNAHFLVGTTSFSSPLEKWRTFTQEDFEDVNKAVKKFMKDFQELAGVLDIYNEELSKRLKFHFWFKSLWFSKFNEVFTIGTITRDGKKINRIALTISNEINVTRPFDYHDQNEELINQLIINKDIDISTEFLKNKLVEVGRLNIEALKEIKKELGEFIRNNCKIENLL